MKINALEAGRGIAAFAVVLFHSNAAATHWDNLPKFAPLQSLIHGVDFFFVISGFIIFHVHRGDIGRPNAARAFAAKRFVRLFPTLWIVVAATALLYIFSHSPPTLWQIAASFTLVPSTTLPIPDVIWTLRHELVFYAAFLILIAHRKFGIALFAVWTAAVIVQMGLVIVGHPVTGLMSFFVSAYEIDFLLGALVARYAFAVRPSWLPLAVGLLVVTATLWLAAATGGTRTSLLDYTSIAATFWVVAIGASFALLLTGMIAAERLVTVPNWLTALGGISYVLYLIHVPMQQLLVHLLNPRVPSGVTMAAIIALPIAAAYALHQVVEKPMGRYLRRRLLGAPAVSSNATAVPSDEAIALPASN